MRGCYITALPMYLPWAMSAINGRNCPAGGVNINDLSTIRSRTQAVPTIDPNPIPP